MAIVVFLVIAGALAHRQANGPFETANQFHRHLQNERFDAAEAMIDAVDRPRIPDGYWQQFRGRPPDFLMSWTLWTFINGRMAIKPTIINHDGLFQEIRYEVYGRHIRIAEVTKVSISPPTASIIPHNSTERSSP